MKIFSNNGIYGNTSVLDPWFEEVGSTRMSLPQFTCQKSKQQATGGRRYATVLTWAVQAAIKNSCLPLRCPVFYHKNNIMNCLITSFKNRDKMYLCTMDATTRKGKIACFEGGIKSDFDISNSAGHYVWMQINLRHLQVENVTNELTDHYEILDKDFNAVGKVEKNNLPSLFVIADILYQYRDMGITDTDDIEEMYIEDYEQCLQSFKDEVEMYVPNIKDILQHNASYNPKPSATPSQVVYASSLLDWTRISEEEPSDEVKYTWGVDLDTTVITEDVQASMCQIKDNLQEKNQSRNILLYGESSAGKTHIAKAMAAMFGIPYTYVACNADTQLIDLFGDYKPSANGGFKFQESPFVKAVRDGGLIEIQEVNTIKPAILAGLNSLLDKTESITLPDENCTVIKRHKNCIIVGTMNVGYAGRNVLDPSFPNRFYQIIEVNPLDKDTMIDIVVKESGNEDKKLINRMYDLYKVVRTKIDEESIENAEIGTNRLIAWATMSKYVDPRKAGYRTIAAMAAGFDKEIEKEIKDLIDNYF